MHRVERPYLYNGQLRARGAKVCTTPDLWNLHESPDASSKNLGQQLSVTEAIDAQSTRTRKVTEAAPGFKESAKSI